MLGPAEEVSLSRITSSFPQQSERLLIFDTFRDDDDIHIATKSDQGVGDAPCLGAVSNPGHEHAIDLQLVKRELEQSLEVGGSNPEIVN